MENNRKQTLNEGVARAKHRPGFMANALNAFASNEQLSDEDVAKWLGCTTDGFSRLALCLRPQSGQREFRSHIEKLAVHCGGDALRIVQLLRKVEAITAIKESHAVQRVRGGMRMAARRADKLQKRQPPDTAKGI
ncbi:MAG: hypothetical protein ABSB42_03375 [Tepidisphaeraceae bacterium]|jgi:hypothetical protein